VSRRALRSFVDSWSYLVSRISYLVKMEATAETTPQFFLHQVQTQPPGKVAMRQKEFGIWREFTWQDSYEQVKDFAMGLIALGVRRGDKICTAGDNDRQHIWAYIALQSAGAAQVGLFTDATPAESAQGHLLGPAGHVGLRRTLADGLHGRAGVGPVRTPARPWPFRGAESAGARPAMWPCSATPPAPPACPRAP
jgi:hypothetical protein